MCSDFSWCLALCLYIVCRDDLSVFWYFGSDPMKLICPNASRIGKSFVDRMQEKLSVSKTFFSNDLKSKSGFVLKVFSFSCSWTTSNLETFFILDLPRLNNYNLILFKDNHGMFLRQAAQLRYFCAFILISSYTDTYHVQNLSQVFMTKLSSLGWNPRPLLYKAAD